MKKSQLRQIIREIIAKKVNPKARRIKKLNEKTGLNEEKVVRIGRSGCACDCGPDIMMSCVGNYVTWSHYEDGYVTEDCNCGCCSQLMPVQNPFIQNQPGFDPNLPSPPMQGGMTRKIRR